MDETDGEEPGLVRVKCLNGGHAMKRRLNRGCFRGYDVGYENGQAGGRTIGSRTTSNLCSKTNNAIEGLKGANKHCIP